MKESKRAITRRDFLRTSSYMAMGSLIALPLMGHVADTKTDKSRVVLIRDESVMDGSGTLRPGNLADMMDQAMITLFNTANAATAWQQLFNPVDVVGIKSNTWARLPTPRELENILQERLNILVMMTPLFHGIGPHHYSKSYIWPYCGLVVSTDPVAADATGAGIIQAKRNEYFGKVRPISPRPLHIEAADTRYGLGNSHPARIELIKLGWEEGVLI